MAWPPKIATAKPHERPSPFDAWYYQAKAKQFPFFPMATELLHFVDNDEEKFAILNQHLEDAFNAGAKSRGKQA